MASSTQKHSFEAFLSFRGEDTRDNFTDHLFVNLDRMGIHTFRDNQLERGEEIKSELLKTIEESTISIVVFSKNYAHSKWCLDELAKIMECRKEMKQMVLPIFYHVDPSDVRKQTGSFGDAFSIHERNIDEKEVQRWRTAMTEAGNLSGYHVNNGYESKYIEEIIEVIRKRLDPKLLHVDDNIVGMNFHLEELKPLIYKQLFGVCVIGIYGIGGIGKTTIAKIVYNDIQCEFNGASFLENVKESFKKGCQLQLQQELLHGIVGQKIELSNVNDGINIIKNRLNSKKVLIVIDDVDHLNQLESLVGSKNWFRNCFGAGTRIIVTTRDQSLLHNYGVDETYRAKELHYEEAIQLFSKHAFKQNVPKEDYVDLSKCMVDYAQGLPLALKVLGTSLHGMTIDEWKSALDKLKNNLKKEINDVLRISFDMLECSEKEIFLDIACFFRGEEKAFVSKILDGCNLYATCNIKVLCDKCLISISNDMIQMHDLIQQMGWAIVREECPNDPSKLSRLWDPNDIYDAFFGQKGMKNIETISLDLSKSKKIQFTPKVFTEMKRVFSKMKKLRLLKVYYSDHNSLLRKEDKMCLPKDFEFPSNLRYLHWEGLESLPLNFHGDNLVAINLKSSNMKNIWKGKKHLEKLKFVDVSDSQQLVKMPDFSSMPNLERLNLRDCTSFRKLHSSIGTFPGMKFLKELHLCGTRIKELPSSIGSLKALEILDLSECSKFEKFPDMIFVNMGHLRSLELCESGIKELPNSIGYLESLESLGLSYCLNFEKFPEIQGNMKCLKNLDLISTAIKELPNNIGCLEALERLYLPNCTAIKELPNSISCLDALKELWADGCSNLEKFPEIQRNMKSLRSLSLSKTAIKELPYSIGHLSKLDELNLKKCNSLRSLPGSICGLKYLEILSFGGHSNLDFLEITEDMEQLECLYLDESAITELSSSIERLKGLRSLHLIKCENLETLPNSIGNLTCLRDLLLHNCPKLHKLPDNLRSLQRCLETLEVVGCNLMEGAIPSDLWCLSSLKSLDVCKNHIRCIPAGIIQLSELETLSMNHCPMLEEIPELPSSLRKIQAYGCPCLDTSSSLIDQLWSSLLNCFKLETKTLESYRWCENYYDYYEGICIVLPGSSGIPEWINRSSGVPEWISHHCMGRDDDDDEDDNDSVGREVSIELPKNWYKDDNFLGFALFSHHLPFDDDDDGDYYYAENDYGYKLSISHGDQFQIVQYLPLDIPCNTYDKGSITDPALVVSFFSKTGISSEYRSPQWNYFKARFFGSYRCDDTAFKVKSCGIHLIYAQAQDHHQKRSSRHDHATEDHPHHKRSRHV